jgi:hypothetical protein
MWTAPGEIVVNREWHTVQSLKFMLIVVWNPIGFHVLKALLKGRKFNAQYYINDIFAQSQIGDGRPGEHGRTSCGCILIIFGHIPRKCQGITLHRSQSNETSASSTYPPDLAPSDFFLFGYVKEKLMRYRAETPSELLVRIRVILAQIPWESLKTVFLEWMNGAIAKMRAGR